MDELTKGVTKKRNRSCADQPEVDRRVGRGSSEASAAVAAATAALASLEWGAAELQRHLQQHLSNCSTSAPWQRPAPWPAYFV